MPDATTSGVVVVTLTLFVVLLVILWRSMHRIAPDEAGVVILLGSYRRVLRPGLNITSPLAQVRHVPLSTRTIDLGPAAMPVIGGEVTLGGTISLRVVDPARAVFQTRDLDREMVAQTWAAVTRSLRGVSLAATGSAAMELTLEARAELDRAAERNGARVETVVLRLARAG